MAWKLAVTFLILNLIFDVIEQLFNFPQARQIVYSPLQALGINLKK